MLRDERFEVASVEVDTSPFSTSPSEEDASPAADNSGSALSESGVAATTEAEGVAGFWPLPPYAYKVEDCGVLDDVRSCGDVDTRKVFRHVRKYQSHLKNLSAPLKPWVTNFVLATGKVDALLKIPRPDGHDDGLGLRCVDEPALQQSDPAILNLKLRTVCMRPLEREHRELPAGSIHHAEEKPHEIDKWIRGVEEHHKKYHHNKVEFSQFMPSVGSVLWLIVPLMFHTQVVTAPPPV